MSSTIALNGKPCTTTAATITGLLKELNINPTHVVVEVNQEIIQREAFTTCTINDTDVVEILRFVGGG